MTFKISAIITILVLVSSIVALLKGLHFVGKLSISMAAIGLLFNVFLLVEGNKVSKSIKMGVSYDIVEIVKTRFYDNQILQDEVSVYLQNTYKNDKNIDFSNISFKTIDKLQEIPRLESKKEFAIYFTGTIHGISEIPMIMDFGDI